jgi:hypothetical protein
VSNNSDVEGVGVDQGRKEVAVSGAVGRPRRARRSNVQVTRPDWVN